MTVFCYRPWSIVRDIGEEVNQLMSKTCHPVAANTENERGRIPADIFEDERCVCIQAEVPGSRSADIEISLEANQLVLQLSKPFKDRGAHNGYTQVERHHLPVKRRFNLPPGLDLEHIKAELKHGVLEITIDKKPAALARHIPVSEA